jgi:hypothetical protein
MPVKRARRSATTKDGKPLYATEDAAHMRVRQLKQYGIWPGVVTERYARKNRKRGDKTGWYYLTYDPSYTPTRQGY